MKKVTELNLGNYIVRYRQDAAIAFHSKLKDRKFQIKDCLDPIAAVKRWINTVESSRSNWKNIKKLTVNFNTNFMTEIMGEADVFYYAFTQDGNTKLLNISMKPQEGYYSAMNKGTNDKHTTCSSGNIYKSNAIDLELIANSRYSLIETDIPNQYELLFDSIVHHANNSYRMGVPGLGINATHLVK